ncbi:universal stress protein [Achromobacter xylosoxidans]
MYRRISVHLDQGFDCKRRTQAAIGLAKRHQAELVGIYATSAPPQYYYGESVLMSRALNVMKDLQAQGRDSVQNAFLAAASQADIPAQVRSDDTSPSASVALHGRVSDLIIVSQLNRDDVEAAHENEFVEQTLLTAGTAGPGRALQRPFPGDRRARAVLLGRQP